VAASVLSFRSRRSRRLLGGLLEAEVIEADVLVPSGRFMAHGTLAFIREAGVTANNVETYCSIFKRGKKGVY